MRLLTLLFICSGATALVLNVQHRTLSPALCRQRVRMEAESVEAPPSIPDLCQTKGCDNGRIMGGLGATWLFQWWPIKVCPSPRRTHQ